MAALALLAGAILSSPLPPQDSRLAALQSGDVLNLLASQGVTEHTTKEAAWSSARHKLQGKMIAAHSCIVKAEMAATALEETHPSVEKLTAFDDALREAQVAMKGLANSTNSVGLSNEPLSKMASKMDDAAKTAAKQVTDAVKKAESELSKVSWNPGNFSLESWAPLWDTKKGANSSLSLVDQSSPKASLAFVRVELLKACAGIGATHCLMSLSVNDTGTVTFFAEVTTVEAAAKEGDSTVKLASVSKLVNGQRLTFSEGDDDEQTVQVVKAVASTGGASPFRNAGASFLEMGTSAAMDVTFFPPLKSAVAKGTKVGIMDMYTADFWELLNLQFPLAPTGTVTQMLKYIKSNALDRSSLMLTPTDQKSLPTWGSLFLPLSF